MSKYLADSYDAALRENVDLKARLAEAETLLSECRHFVKALCDHDDATCGCYQHLVLRGIDAFLARENERE